MTHLKRPGGWERFKAGGDGMTEDELVGWHHQFDGHEFEQPLTGKASVLQSMGSQRISHG